MPYPNPFGVFYVQSSYIKVYIGFQPNHSFGMNSYHPSSGTIQLLLQHVFPDSLSVGKPVHYQWEKSNSLKNPKEVVLLLLS